MGDSILDSKSTVYDDIPNRDEHYANWYGDATEGYHTLEEDEGYGEYGQEEEEAEAYGEEEEAWGEEEEVEDLDSGGKYDLQSEQSGDPSFQGATTTRVEEEDREFLNQPHVDKLFGWEEGGTYEDRVEIGDTLPSRVPPVAGQSKEAWTDGYDAGSDWADSEKGTPEEQVAGKDGGRKVTSWRLSEQPISLGPSGLTQNNPPKPQNTNQGLRSDYLALMNSARRVIDNSILASGRIVNSQKAKLLNTGYGIEGLEDTAGPDIRAARYHRDDRKLHIGSPIKTQDAQGEYTEEERAASLYGNAPRYDSNGIREGIHPGNKSGTRHLTSVSAEIEDRNNFFARNNFNKNARGVHQSRNRNAHELFKALKFDERENELLELADETGIFGVEDPTSLIYEEEYDPNKHSKGRQEKLNNELLKGSKGEQAWMTQSRMRESVNWSDNAVENNMARQLPSTTLKNMGHMKMKHWLNTRYGKQYAKTLSAVPTCSVMSVDDVRNGGSLHQAALKHTADQLHFAASREHLLERIQVPEHGIVYSRPKQRTGPRETVGHPELRDSAQDRMIDRLYAGDKDGIFGNPLEDPYLNAVDDYFILRKKGRHIDEQMGSHAERRDQLAAGGALANITKEDFNVQLLGDLPYYRDTQKKYIVTSPTRTAYHIRRYEADKALRNEQVESERFQDAERKRMREAMSVLTTSPYKSKGTISDEPMEPPVSFSVAGVPRHPVERARPDKPIKVGETEHQRQERKDRSKSSVPKNYQFDSDIARLCRAMADEKKSNRSLGEIMDRSKSGRKVNEYLAAAKDELADGRKKEAKLKCQFLSGIHAGYRKVVVNKTHLDPFVNADSFY